MVRCDAEIVRHAPPGTTIGMNGIKQRRLEDAAAFLQQHPETRARFDKVAALVEGFESPFGLELLSIVHWVMKNESVKSVDDVISHTYAWNERKRQFTPRQIALSVDVLSSNGWVMLPKT